MVIMIDIDGTVCEELSPFDRPLAKPLAGAVKAVNQLVKDGHTVVFWTGRGWDQYRVTKDWLEGHGFKYAQLLMGKPIANLIIDDRACRFEGWDRDYLRLAHSPRRVPRCRAPRLNNKSVRKH
jgi:hypothetical protein